MNGIGIVAHERNNVQIANISRRVIKLIDPTECLRQLMNTNANFLTAEVDCRYIVQHENYTSSAKLTVICQRRITKNARDQT